MKVIESNHMRAEELHLLIVEKHSTGTSKQEDSINGTTCFCNESKEGKMNDYRKILGEIWPELTAYLDRNGIHNFSIWNAADLVFGYYENADGSVISPEEEKVKAAID